MPSRYQPIGNYLAGQPPETVTVTLTLSDVERVLGQPLPQGARARTWWANSWGTTRARVWLMAGWRVDTVALRVGTPTVTFVRGTPDTTA